MLRTVQGQPMISPRTVARIHARRTMWRRPGNIMLFVMFILGSLFAASMGFLALMRTDRQSLAASAEDQHRDAIIESIVDEALVGRRVTLLGLDDIPYNQDFVAAGNFGLPSNPDAMDHWAEIPGRDPWLASIEPHSSARTDPNSPLNPAYSLEYFAATDLFRATDGRPDFVAAPAQDFLVPRLPASRPLRIRPLRGTDQNWPGFLDQDATDDTWIYDGALTDADGEGVFDSRAVSLRVLGGGDRDWFAALGAGPDGPGGNDDANCNEFAGGVGGTAATWQGAPSFTPAFVDQYPPPLIAPPQTLLPADSDCAAFKQGSAFSRQMRREIASALRQEGVDANQIPDQGGDIDDLYISLRLIPNGGMANLNDSHWTLVDNLLGLDPQQIPVAERLKNLPYGTGSEQWLRRRYILPPRDLSSTGAEGLAVDVAADGIAGALYRMFIEPMDPVTTAAAGDHRWFPLIDQPWVEQVALENMFDKDFAKRWTNALRWNDPANSAGIAGQFNYDIRHLLTTDSRDDAVRRGNSLPAWFPAYDPQAENGDGDWTTELGTDGGLVAANGDQYLPPNTAPPTALKMFPGYDGSAACNPATTDCTVPGNWIGDRSFIDPWTAKPKVPLRLGQGPSGLQGYVNYFIPLDARGGEDLRFENMQFALHSIGNIDNPTVREIQTVQAYFTLLLSNIPLSHLTALENVTTVTGGWGGGGADPRNIIQRIRNQAAQLTANFIDFADTNSIPTRIVSSYPYPVLPAPQPQPIVYYGVENQPYISQVVVGDATVQPGVELFNPHARDIPLGGNDPLYPHYGLRLVDGAGAALVPDGLFDVVDADASPQPPLSARNHGTEIDTLLAQMTTIQLTANPFIVQLLAQLPTGEVVVIDEVDVKKAADENIAIDQMTAFSLERDTSSQGGWRTTVPKYYSRNVVSDAAADLGGSNDFALDTFSPVHAVAANLGLEGSYPNVGAMLLLMRYAHEFNINATGANLISQNVPVTRRLVARLREVDNGHMPIYDMTEVAQLQVANDPGDDLNILDSSPALAGVDVLAVPWGQLVYDYFTALPFSNQFDPVNGFAVGGTPLEAGNIADGLETPATDDGVPGDAGFARYLRANQPTVTAGGLVVHGRINLNAAPWKVLEGLPMFSPWQMPIYKDMKVSLFPGGFGTPGNSNAVPRNMTWTQLTHPWVNPSEAGPYTPMQSLTNTALTPLNAAAYGGGGVPAALEQLGRERAESIVAYREMRPVVQVDAAGVATIPSTGNYNVLTLSGKRVRSNTTGTPWELADQRQTAGFLTVGELANVRLSNPAHQGPFTSPSDGLMAYHMDNGQHLGSFYPSQTTTQANYLVAVAPLVALNDSWLTVKGHSYTLYGTLRGAGRQVHLANDPDTPENDYGLPGDIQKNAVRFEVGIDRSNLLTSPANPSLRPAITYSVREPYLSAN